MRIRTKIYSAAVAVTVAATVIFLLGGCAFSIVQKVAAIGERREHIDYGSIQVPVEPGAPARCEIKVCYYIPKTDSPMTDSVRGAWCDFDSRTVAFVNASSSLPVLPRPSPMRFTRCSWGQDQAGCLPRYELYQAKKPQPAGRLTYAFPITDPEKPALLSRPPVDAAVLQFDCDLQRVSLYRYNAAANKMVLLGTRNLEVKEWTAWWAWPSRIMLFPIALVEDGIVNIVCFCGLVIVPAFYR